MLNFWSHFGGKELGFWEHLAGKGQRLVDGVEDTSPTRKVDGRTWTGPGPCRRPGCKSWLLS